jgi:drug/metabolite transporter (DMT)-like permease
MANFMDDVSKHMPSKNAIADAVKIPNPIDHIASSILITFKFLSIATLAMYLALLALHCWRFKQTKTKYHLVLAVGLLFASVAQILQVSSSKLVVIAASFPVNAVSSLFALVLSAYLLACW